MRHPHAELMAQYAQDALETDKPWERWEFKRLIDEFWQDCVEHPAWTINFEYRRKPPAEMEKPVEYAHRYTRNPGKKSVEVVKSMLDATHISIYKLGEEGRGQWIYDMKLPETLLAIFNTHKKAVDLYDKL